LKLGSSGDYIRYFIDHKGITLGKRFAGIKASPTHPYVLKGTPSPLNRKISRGGFCS
jgi:hypothetical protein